MYEYDRDLEFYTKDEQNLRILYQIFIRILKLKFNMKYI